MAHVWVSVCPSTGVPSAYPSFAQQRLEAWLRDGAEGVCALGPECFSAEVYRGWEGNLFQRTPSRGNRPPGGRTVARVPSGAPLRVWRDALARFSLHRTAARPLECPLPLVPDVPLWQWSSCASLRQTQERHWVSYADDAQEEISRAFLRGDAAASITVGVARYRVVFHRGEPYHIQEDELTSTRYRWVRRPTMSGYPSITPKENAPTH